MHRLTTLAVVLLCITTLTACNGTEQPSVSSEDLGATPQVVATDDTDDADDGDGDDDPTTEDAEAEEPDSSQEPTPEPPTFEEVCEDRDDEAFIEVLTPMPGTELSSPFTVTGCGNTFEATYLWRVELADGTVAGEGFGTMTCGSGCVGEFEQEIDVDATGEATIVVFESSAEDGSEENVVEVAITLA